MRSRDRMRRRWLLCLAVAVAAANGVFAQHVSRETAQSVAETFFNQNVRNGQGQLVQFEDISAETPFQNFYIFSADSGFVIVAADERVTPILGYSKTNRFVTEDMPENLRWWLEGYDGQIQAIKDNAVPATSEIATKWSCLKAGEAEPVRGNRSVELPLTTKWNQGAPYNYSCPITSGGAQCVTGCTATAVAQVLKYWNYPIQGMGNKTLDTTQINGTVKHPECYPIYVDFSATTYDWQNMDDVLTSSSPQEKIDAVDTLMKHCGVAMNMNYGVPSEGGSLAPYIMNSLVEYFDYSVAGHYEYSFNYQDEEWKNLLKHEIDDHRPIAYRGESNGGAHAFVFYGYDDGNRFLVNWGWGGHQDDYFTIGALNPESGGIGGGSYDYNKNNCALLHLMPNDRTLNPPANIIVNNTGENALQLEWSPAQYAGSYLILKNGHYLAETTLTNYLDTDVYGGSNTYQIITVGENHRASLPSGSMTYTKPYESPVPTDLSASATGTSVELSWDAPFNTAISFHHHKTPYDDTELERVGGKRFNNLCYEVFRPSDFAQYSNRYITSIGYRISTRMVGTLHNIKVYKGSFPSSGTLLSSHQYFPNASGIYNDYLSNPIRIEGNEDIIIEIEVLESIQDPFDCIQGNDDLATSYITPVEYLEKLGSGKHFIVDLYAKWADELTYNVYRNDGHHTICIARNLPQPCYTDANVPAGVYSYYVTTNYFGGESEPSETVSVGCGNFTVSATSNPLAGGIVTGNQGSYPAGSMVTLTATAASGYTFSGWVENGVRVSNSPTYTFQALANRHLAATFVSTEFSIGSLVTNPDGSQGVVFHLSKDGTEGWMVALNDASEGCSWGQATDIVSMKNVPNNDPTALNDLSGYLNTGLIRAAQGIDNEYAASLVDYENGWYLPSVGQLRKLYAALPFIEGTITEAGGTLMTEGTYWSSTEFSASDASTPMFALGNTSKTSTCRVRAIRNFVAAGNNVVLVSSNNFNLGTATVSGNGTFVQGQTVTVTATPEVGCAFEYWSENGAAVSFDAVYQFSFTHTRSLMAHFSVKGSVGSIVCNADGTKGVVFYLSPDGTEGLMAALEDASEGCQWGPTEKVYSLVSCPFNDPTALKDISGARNTRGIRHYQGTENEYAATLVDFTNGWYLPSAGELRKLYAALPMIEMPLAIAGGCSLTEDTYWSSTEYSATDALTPSFNMGNTGKGATCRVRAIRSFAVAGPNCVMVKSNNENLGTAYVSGTGEFAVGQSVTVTASPAAGYVFDSWTEAGMTVSYSPVYQFNFTRSRALTAIFVSPASVGSTVVNADGSKGVVFYTFPSGIGGLMVALEDDSEGCPWGLNEDITILDNQSPDTVINLLNDMNGRNNTVKIRAWYEGNSEYAACKVDLSHGWYLPSAGQLRKLYGALPMIENALINAEGTMLRDDAYWSSTEQSVDNAWSPSFAMSSSSKTGNCRVRAIRSVLGTEIIAANVNIVDAGTVVGDGEYDVGQTCTMTAIPAEGYTFVNWTDNRSVVSTLPTIQFVVDDSRTLTANFLPTDSISSQAIVLSAGWNWFSTYLDITLDDLKAALVSTLPGTNISINSQGVGSTTYANNRWRGTLTALDLSQMYMINVTADCEMTLVGVPIDPSVHPVTIHPDFNWMAFPLSQGMTLTNVFEGFAVNGDMVISQAEGSSTYTNRWRGTLSTLEPGRGYMYKSTITVGDRVFTFPISTK